MIVLLQFPSEQSFLKFRLTVTETWDLALRSPGCSRWKKALICSMVRGLMSVGQQISFCFFTFSQSDHHPPHPPHRAQKFGLSPTLTLVFSRYNMQQQQGARLEIVSNFYNIISISVTVSLACLPHYPLKRKNFLKTHWYCLTLTMTYNIGI